MLENGRSGRSEFPEKKTKTPENKQSKRSKLFEKLIICSDNGASYASDLPEDYFKENSHFVAKSVRREGKV